jgi:hypothetical protein
MTKPASSVLPQAARDRAHRATRDQVDDRDSDDRDGEAAEHREQVLPPAPVELTGREQLGDEDQTEQRRGAVEDVGRGREPLDEQRQPGATKLTLVGADPVADCHGADCAPVSGSRPPGSRGVQGSNRRRLL